MPTTGLSHLIPGIVYKVESWQCQLDSILKIFATTGASTEGDLSRRHAGISPRNLEQAQHIAGAAGRGLLSLRKQSAASDEDGTALATAGDDVADLVDGALASDANQALKLTEEEVKEIDFQVPPTKCSYSSIGKVAAVHAI